MNRNQLATLWIATVLLIPTGLSLYFASSDYLREVRIADRLIRLNDENLETKVRERSSLPGFDNQKRVEKELRSLGEERLDLHRKKELPRHLILSGVLVVCNLSLAAFFLRFFRNK